MRKPTEGAEGVRSTERSEARRVATASGASGCAQISPCMDFKTATYGV